MLFHTVTQLGPAYVGLTGTIGYRVVASDGETILTAFTTSGVFEASTLDNGGPAGDYVAPAGITLPDDTPCTIQWGDNSTWYTQEFIDTAYFADYISDDIASIKAKTDLISAVTVNIISAVVGSTLNIIRGCTLTANFTGLGVITGRDELYITVKSDVDDADTEAIFKIEETAGLQVLNGSYYDPTAGSITVTNAGTGALTVTLTGAAAKLLNTSRRLYYDMKMVDGAVITQLISGYATVTGDVTRLD